jgi:translation elongation factor EF-G
MGSNIERIKEICCKIDEVLPSLEQEIKNFDDLMDKEQFDKIFSLADKKKLLLEELKKLLESETSIPENLNAIKNEILRKTLEVNTKELEFYKVNREKTKEFIIQISQKKKVKNEYIKKITKSYFVDKKVK